MKSKADLIFMVSMVVLTLVFVLQGVLAIGGAVFSDHIADPPLVELQLSEREAIGDAAAVVPIDSEITVAFQTERLTATGPRIVWSAATSLIYFGVALLVALLAIGVRRSKDNALFSAPMQQLLTFASFPFTLMMFGSLGRNWSVGWVARAYDAGEAAEVVSTFSNVSVLFPLLLILGMIGVSQIWKQGRTLQQLSDQTV